MKKLIIPLIFLMSLVGCNVSKSDQTPSRDLTALQAKIKINLPVQSASWEVFGTPEYKGGVPGPTDLQTLIAEIVLKDSDFKSHHRLALVSDHFVAPESARFWLSPIFREILDQVRNSTENMGRAYGCFQYETSLIESGRPVAGFLCVSGNRALMYLTLDRR